MKFAVVPSHRSDFVALARVKGGQLFRKEILRHGRYAHPHKPGEWLDVDDALFASIVKNFNDEVCDIVQVPMVNDSNAHSEAPDRNIGEVVGLEVEGDKMFATIDARKHADDLGKTLIGASAFYAVDYTNTATGSKVGPTLLHVAVTNRPHITGLEPFCELVAASSDPSLEEVVNFDPASESGDTNMTLEELKASLKADHNIDVDGLTAAATAATATATTAENQNKDLMAALSAVAPALEKAGLVKLSAAGTETDPKEVIAGFTKLAESNVALTARLGVLEDDKVTKEVEDLVAAGKILPANKDAAIKLAKQDHELFLQMVPAEAIVKLSSEQGVETVAGPTEASDKEVERLVALANGTTTGK